MTALKRKVDARPVWGRTGSGRSWRRSLIASAPIVLGPIASISTFITLNSFDGSFSSFYAAVEEEGFWTTCMRYGPELSRKGVAAVACWVGFQVLLFLYLPCDVRTGQYTPAGHLLIYRLNGLYSWIVTHLLYFTMCGLGIVDPAFIPRNWSSLIAAMNLAGLLVPVLAFIKAYLRPTHPEDCKFSGMFVFHLSVLGSREGQPAHLLFSFLGWQVLPSTTSTWASSSTLESAPTLTSSSSTTVTSA